MIGGMCTGRDVFSKAVLTHEGLTYTMIFYHVSWVAGTGRKPKVKSNRRYKDPVWFLVWQVERLVDALVGYACT